MDVTQCGRDAVELAIEEQGQFLRARLQARRQDVPGILQARAERNLVAVVRRNRYLLDSRAGEEQLDRDLGIEVQSVAVERKRNAPERRDRVGAIPGVKLAQSSPQKPALDPAQDAIAQVFVERHAAPGV